MATRALLVLHVFPSFAFGGQQRRLATLIAKLGPAFSHRVISLDGDDSGKVLLDGSGSVVEPLVLAKSGFVSVGNLRRLRSLIAETEPDLLCTYNFGSIEAIIANRIGRRTPHVHHEDGFGPDEDEDTQKAKRVLARRLLLTGSLVATPSTVLERVATDIWRLDAARVRRIGVGIDVARFQTAKPARTTGPVVVGALGSLRPEKNFARLIRCFTAASEGGDARLVIFGDGPERRRLEDAAKGDPRITFAGPTSAPEVALAGVDIFALSSDTEQTPISLMESMATGLPALATDVGDIRLMLGEASADFVIPPRDEARYVAQLRRLFADRALRERLGAANAARAPMFDETAMIGAFRALYLEAASR